MDALALRWALEPVVSAASIKRLSDLFDLIAGRAGHLALAEGFQIV